MFSFSFPVVDWFYMEKQLQFVLHNAEKEALCEVGQWVYGPDPYYQEGFHDAWVEKKHPERYYPSILCKHLSDAAFYLFKRNQGREEPTCSVFCQVELDDNTLLLKAMVGGQGVEGKVREWKRDLVSRFYETLLKKINKDCVDGQWEKFLDFAFKLTKEINEHPKINIYVKCQTVSAEDYILNNMLNRNYLPVHEAEAKLATPTDDYLCNAKTYSCSIVNGYVLKVKGRFRLLDKVRTDLCAYRCRLEQESEIWD